MTQQHIRMRKGSKQGEDHIRLGFNNQDAVLAETFYVPAFERTYYVGLVSDGSTGFPLFSHTEVGSNLMVVYAYARIQELICAGMSVNDVPIALYPSITEFLRNIMNMVIQPSIVWPYPEGVPKRDEWNSQKRFRVDYLAATLLGFICDETDVVLFSAGDGVKLVDDEIFIIDQDDKPEYPAVTINQSGAGFEVEVFSRSSIERIAIATDGLKHLMQDEDFVNEMFSHQPESAYLGLQNLLRTVNMPHLMKDDATAVTWEKIKEED